MFEHFAEILAKARSNKSANKPDTELNEFESVRGQWWCACLCAPVFRSCSGGQILDEHRRQGEEDQAFEKRVEGKKAAAKKKATRRCEPPLFSCTCSCERLTLLQFTAARKKVQVQEPEADRERTAAPERPKRRAQTRDVDGDGDENDDMYV